MKCYLSGMSELRLGLNDKVMFESTGRSGSFPLPFLFPLLIPSSCAWKSYRDGRYQISPMRTIIQILNDRTIPSDDEFELMSYRLSTLVKPLFWVEVAVESHKGSRVEYMVKVKAQFKGRSTANNVEVYVPVPDDGQVPSEFYGLLFFWFTY